MFAVNIEVNIYCVQCIQCVRLFLIYSWKTYCKYITRKRNVIYVFYYHIIIEYKGNINTYNSQMALYRCCFSYNNESIHNHNISYTLEYIYTLIYIYYIMIMYTFIIYIYIYIYLLYTYYTLICYT